MGRRRFTNTAIKSYITTSLNGVDVTTTISVSATSGGATAPPVNWPAVPFFAAVNRGAADEEVVKVTAVSGSSVTFTRGSSLSGESYGSTTQTHLINATIEHVMTAADLDEANDHVNDSSDVHGITGNVVGTGGTQTLTDKTLTTPTLTVPVVASFASAEHTHAAAGATGGTIAHSVLTGLTTGDPHTQYQEEDEKGAANGYASLDGTTKVPYAQLPTGTAASTVAIGDHTHTAGFSGARALKSGSQNISNETWEAVLFGDTDAYDTNSYHNPAANNSRMTIPANGYYRILMQIVWEGNATGRRVMNMRLNDTSSDATGGTEIAKVHEVPAVAVVLGQQIAYEGYFEAGDQIRVFVWHNKGGLLALEVSSSFYTISRIDY